MHSSSSLGTCQSGCSDHQGLGLAAQADREIAQAPADARIIAVAMEIEKQKNGRLILGQAFEAVEGRQRIADGLGRAIRQPGDPINEIPAKTGCAVRAGAAARPSRVSIRSSSRAADPEDRSNGPRISRSSWSDQDSVMGPASIAIRLNAVGRAAPSADPAVAPSWTNWGLWPIVSAVLQTAGPGQAAPQVVAARQLEVEAARRSSDLDQTGPGGRGTHWGYRSQSAKGQKNRDHQAA